MNDLLIALAISMLINIVLIAINSYLLFAVILRKVNKNDPSKN